MEHSYEHAAYKNISRAIKIWWLEIILSLSAAVAMTIQAGSSSHAVWIAKVLLVLAAVIAIAIVAAGHWTMGNVYQKYAYSHLVIAYCCVTILVFGVDLISHYLPSISPVLKENIKLALLGCELAILCAIAKTLVTFPAIFNKIKYKLQIIIICGAVATAAFEVLAHLKHSGIEVVLMILLEVIGFTFIFASRVYNYLLLKVALAHLTDGAHCLGRFEEIVLERTKTLWAVLFVIVLTLLAWFLLIKDIDNLHTEVKVLNQRLSNQVVLGDKTRFEMNKECASYQTSIEDKLKGDYSEYDPADSVITDRLEEIFYSPKANSCLYISMELQYSHGKLVIEQPRLVNALTQEVLYAGIREVGSESYQSDALRFNNYVDAYR